MNKTIFYKGVEFDVDFYYQPEEPMIMYYADGSGYPGSPAEIEIYEIKHKGTYFYEVLEDNLDDIEDLIWEKLEE